MGRANQGFDPLRRMDLVGIHPLPEGVIFVGIDPIAQDCGMEDRGERLLDGFFVMPI